MDDEGVLPNAPIPITTNVSVSFLPVERNLTGNDLWKVNFFTSANEDGSSPQGPQFEQILSPSQASRPLSPGDDTLFIEDVEIPPINLFQLSCGPTPYLCMQLSKHENSSTKFSLETTSREKSIVKCIEQECALGK